MKERGVTSRIGGDEFVASSWVCYAILVADTYRLLMSQMDHKNHNSR